MKRIIRTTIGQLLLSSAFGVASTTACSSAPPSAEESVGSTAEAIISKCKPDDDCPITCPPGTIYNLDLDECVSKTILPCPPPNVRIDGVCTVATPCPFSVACAPGEYTTSVSPLGCSLTAPATCQTSATPPGGGVFALPGAFIAPVVTSIALGASSVYAIGVPAVPAADAPPTGDTRAAVFAWGNNEYGQLGDGTYTSSTNTSTPVVPLFVPGNPVTQVVAGDTDACGLLADGSVQCWGYVVTDPGAIAFPTATALQFPAGVTIAQLTHGQHHACAIGSDDNVYCWGNNNRGQLGQPPAQYPSIVPFSGIGTALPVAFPATANGPKLLKVISVAASGDSTCALTNLQYPATPTAPSYAIQSIYCWGDDEEYSLGDNKTTPGDALGYESSPILIGVDDGLGDGKSKPFSTIVGGSNGSAQQAGSFCAQASGSPASWYCWGGNDFGQLDLPIPSMAPGSAFNAGVPSPTPVSDANVQTAASISLSGDHGCVVAATSSATPQVYCFGDNNEGQLGFTASTVPPVNVGGAQTSVAMPSPAPFPGFNNVAAGYQFTCGSYTVPRAAGSTTPPSYGTPTAKGNLACWGLSDGELAVSTAVPTLLNW